MGYRSGTPYPCLSLCYNVTSLSPVRRGSRTMDVLKTALRNLSSAALAAALFGLAAAVPAPAADRVAVIAADNIYGDVAAQIGGGHVAVASLISNPSQDPHLFEAT